MSPRRIVTGLALAFGGMSLLLVVAGLLANPGLLVLAAVFLGVTYLLWYHASGRLARRVYRQVENQARVDDRGVGRHQSPAGRGGFGAGPREEWTGPRRGGRQTPGDGARRGARQRGQQRRRRARAATGGGELTAREAYDVLGLDPGADAEAVRTAYRERIKEVHPDTDGGDQAAFRRVRTAYERLTD